MATADVLNHQQVVEQEYDRTVREDIELFRSQSQEFLSGKLTADEFRPDPGEVLIPVVSTRMEQSR